MLWSIINVIQLIVNLPLLNLTFPSNAVKFYSFLTDLANFDVIPSTWVNTVQRTLFPSLTLSEPRAKLSDMGWDTENFIMNLGSSLLYFLVLLCLILLSGLLYFVRNRHQR
jgi:hypothetical protein